VAKPLKSEEQLKADIFNIYSKCREEQSSDRRQVYFGQLCDSVFRWCTSYLFSAAKEMGVEIVEALERIVKKEKMPEEENDFFKYMVTTLYNAKNEYYRNNKSNNIKIPRIVYDMEKMILSQESNTGRKLSEEEKIECISKWFNKTEKKAKECLQRIENKNVVSLTTFDDEEKDIPDSYNEPESMFFSKINTPDSRKAVETVLQSKQKRTRECYRALFTAYCIDNSIDFEGAASVLNAEIFEKYLNNRKKPDQYEVYKMYHPKVKKESAEVRASEMLKTFLNDLKTAIKEKN
jgi:hypothetical protein